MGGGMARVSYPGMSWKRRHQNPVKSKNRLSQKAIDEAELAEYPDTGYFKVMQFMVRDKIAILCPLPNSNMTNPHVSTYIRLFPQKRTDFGG